MGLKFLYNDFPSHHENNLPNGVSTILLSVFKGLMIEIEAWRQSTRETTLGERHRIDLYISE